MKSVCNFFFLDEAVGSHKLLKCPEVRVRGLTDTLPSFLLKEDSIKSVSVWIMSGKSRLAGLFVCSLAKCSVMVRLARLITDTESRVKAKVK